ncbi:16S rRNA processing protein RimM [Sphaerotilus hippei]|uniref:Ribosome maturation factor RimM n=1 Tax=Sphaerotilus hippei TaxID=744406 RepID=A0A318GXF1_9BURK|nr:ribosome maturation factor RimM [Sphaerotilus hippei]PXW94187.1 16S rRNA processing protein RimM [Sphaerotilus hippei]
MSSIDDDIVWPEDAIEVAKVIDAWGIKGWIRVHPYSADPQAVFSSRRWFVQPPADRPVLAGAAALPRVLCITHAKEHGDGVVAAAQEIPDRNTAEALKGARIFVSRSSFPTVGDGEYYWVDLIGLQVVNRADEVLGTVVDLAETGAQSVLRLVRTETDAGGKSREVECLIPFVSAYIDEVSLERRRIVADWGLDY